MFQLLYVVCLPFIFCSSIGFFVYRFQSVPLFLFRFPYFLLSCVVLFCVVLSRFILLLFCSLLSCFVWILFCFCPPLYCFVSFSSAFTLFSFVLFRFVPFNLFVLFCSVLICFRGSTYEIKGSKSHSVCE